MYTVDINPVAFVIGSLSVKWGTIWLIVGIIVALFFFLIEGKRNGIPKYHSILVFVLLFLLALVCARILHIIESATYYDDPGPLLTLSGRRIYGAIGGAALAVFIYSKFSRIQFFKLTDSSIIALISCLTILRVGCFISGCCYGLPCDLPWSVQYSNPDTLSLINIPIHPTQVYHFILGGITVIICWFWRRTLKKPGTLTFLGLALYCLGDIIVRFFRANEPIPSFSLILGIILFIISSIMFFMKFRIKY